MKRKYERGKNDELEHTGKKKNRNSSTLYVCVCERAVNKGLEGKKIATCKYHYDHLFIVSLLISIQ